MPSEKSVTLNIDIEEQINEIFEEIIKIYSNKYNDQLSKDSDEESLLNNYEKLKTC